MVTVQHVLMFRVSRAVAASLLARSIDPSKQYRGGGQFTPSATAAGRAASVLARSIDSSKQYRCGGQFTPSATAAGRAASVLARSIDSSKQYDTVVADNLLQVRRRRVEQQVRWQGKLGPVKNWKPSSMQLSSMDFARLPKLQLLLKTRTIIRSKPLEHTFRNIAQQRLRN
jgi:hypothetical protein